MGCTLIELYGTHPSPKRIEANFKELGIEMRIVILKEIALNALIACPKGRIEI